MIDIDRVRADLAQAPEIRPTYRTKAGLFLFQRPDSIDLRDLATQAAADRQVWFRQISPSGESIEIGLCEDGYTGWIPCQDLFHLEPSPTAYHPTRLDRAAIVPRLAGAIAFAQAAQARPHRYVWGACLGPDYDCSGLVQAAFAAVGLWLPRDSYQQEAFCQPIAPDAAEPGDLVFFGIVPERANHVAIYLGPQAIATVTPDTAKPKPEYASLGHYIHCCGYDQGRGGISIDPLADLGDRVTRTYFSQWRGFGRIMASYEPPPRS